MINHSNSSQSLSVPARPVPIDYEPSNISVHGESLQNRVGTGILSMMQRRNSLKNLVQEKNRLQNFSKDTKNDDAIKDKMTNRPDNSNLKIRTPIGKK